MDKVLVAMSGGVDSSVAAALLKEQGYECICITMSLYCSNKTAENSCCGFAAIDDARKVAKQLGMPHYVVNFKEEFQKYVINDFISEYQQGRTPNPCIRCNQFLKFDHLLKKADELGAKWVATGHYADLKQQTTNNKQQTISKDQIPVFKLLKAKDEKKDQSYVLYRLDQASLGRILFPLGVMRKDEVRKKAKALNLPVHDKEESQEICFIEDDNYIRFLKEQVPGITKPGDIVDIEGGVVGQHEGIAFYTIGQRKGIGAHKGQPKYVVKLDSIKNQVVIGDDKDLLKSELRADQMHYISGQVPSGPIAVMAKIRYNSNAADATVYPETNKTARIVFKQAQRAITPGQSVVLYNGDEVVGGGLIC